MGNRRVQPLPVAAVMMTPGVVPAMPASIPKAMTRAPMGVAMNWSTIEPIGARLFIDALCVDPRGNAVMVVVMLDNPARRHLSFNDAWRRHLALDVFTLAIPRPVQVGCERWCR
jgi:hypothetical protein